MPEVPGLFPNTIHTTHTQTHNTYMHTTHTIHTYTYTHTHTHTTYILPHSLLLSLFLSFLLSLSAHSLSAKQYIRGNPGLRRLGQDEIKDSLSHIVRPCPKNKDHEGLYMRGPGSGTTRGCALLE